MHRFVLIVEKRTGIDRRTTRAVMIAWREFMAAEIASGEHMLVWGVGSFKARYKKGMTCSYVKFSASKLLKKQIQKNHEQRAAKPH